MLTHLSIKNFTLVNQLDLSLEPGMTAITGETGAGKSILLDALSLTLGDRADYSRIRKGADRAEVSAQFDISASQEAKTWLQSQEMDTEDECLLRRSINSKGKSSAWVNGQMVTLNQLRDLAEMLISIHSQHEHQALAKPAHHRQLLDQFAQHADLTLGVKESYATWTQAQERLTELEAQFAEGKERLELLSFQVEELTELSIADNEFENLEQEQKTLANVESILATLSALQELLEDSDSNNLQQGAQSAISLIDKLPLKTSNIKDTEELLRSAAIQLQEAGSLIQREADSVELDPRRLASVEERLSQIFHISRKYRTPPEKLAEHCADLKAELARLTDPESALQEAKEHEQQCLKEFLENSKTLSLSRKKAAEKLTTAVNQHFEPLSMRGAEIRFAIDYQPDNIRNQWGADHIQLLVRTNPGQDHGHISKIASGGELSRISLAIQVVTARSGQTPTLIFDEVDVGIGGATADTVGGLLNDLGQRAQIICITHLAQVASKANQQLLVSKETTAESAESQIAALNTEERVEEIARMLGGASVSEKSRENAKEMLNF